MIQGNREPDATQYEFVQIVDERSEEMKNVMRRLGYANDLRAWHDQLPPEHRSSKLFGYYVLMVQALVHPTIKYDSGYDEHFLHLELKDGSLLLMTEETVQFYRKKE